MRRRTLALLFAAAAAFVLSHAASAAKSTSPVLSQIVKKGELRVGMTGGQPPLNMTTRSGELIGLEVDLARALAGAMKVKPRFVLKPFNELLPSLEKGELDVVMSGVTITPERNLRVAFLGPYFLSGKSILTKSSSLAQADEASDMDDSSITLTALAGSTSQEFVEKLIPQATLIVARDYQSGVDLVLQDKADAMVADFPICLLSVLRHQEAGLATLVAPLTVEPIGIALPANDPLLLNMVGNYLGTLDAMGMLEELRKKWFEDGSWISQLP